MVLPHLLQRLEQNGALVRLLLHVFLASGWERGNDFLGGETVEVLRDERRHAAVEHLAFLCEHNVVRKAVVLLERELERIVRVDFADVSG